MKYEELVALRQCLKDKMDRDLRKYEVSSYDNIPYDTWILLGTAHGYAPSFDVPAFFYGPEDNVLKMELTPLYIVKYG